MMQPVFATFDLKIKSPEPPMLSTTTPRSPSRPIVRKATSEKSNFHLKISNIAIRGVSEAIRSALSLTFRFSGDIINEQLVAKTLDSSAKTAISITFQYIAPIQIKISDQEQLKSKHLILSLWDRSPKSGGNFLGQCVLSLDSLASSTSTAFEAKILSFSVSCGSITGTIELLNDRLLTGSFIQKFSKEEYVV
eukprot:c12129_g1_i3.p1 GENE.c12129_g1_i3~~c12129_g1_i3.p1  ORF type:complete len:193 (+),score=29.68 c12129_g1_i3:97-675(+)